LDATASQDIWGARQILKKFDDDNRKGTVWIMNTSFLILGQAQLISPPAIRFGLPKRNEISGFRA
jgi:hypothetical protein